MQSSSTSKTEVKKRIERYLEALKAVSQQDPDSFAEIAPELIQRSTLNWRGSDPFFAKSLNEWLNLDMMWTPFTDIIPKDAHITKRIEDDAFDLMQKYLNSIKMYFSSYEDSEEIFMDFENRISENLYSISNNANDVVIVFGASPLSLETTKALDKIKKREAFIIVATDMYTSQAASNADIIVALGNETLNFLPSILPYAAFSEILVSQIMTKSGKKMLARIKKFEDELSEMGAYIRPSQ